MLVSHKWGRISSISNRRNSVPRATLPLPVQYSTKSDARHAGVVNFDASHSEASDHSASASREELDKAKQRLETLKNERDAARAQLRLLPILRKDIQGLQVERKETARAIRQYEAKMKTEQVQTKYAQNRVDKHEQKLKDLGIELSKAWSLAHSRKSDFEKFFQLCIENDLNVIARMLPSMVEPVFSRETLDAADPVTRLQNWLFDLEGKSPEKRAQMDSMMRHDSLVRDGNLISIYTDGALFYGSRRGSAAIVPSLGYARLQGGGLNRGGFNSTEKAYTSGATELDGLTLALESAVDLVKPQQRVVIFTDYRAFADQDALVMWLEDARHNSRTLHRTLDALKQLEKKHTQIRICWLAKDCLIQGSRLAHQGARMSAYLDNNEDTPLILSEDTWANTISTSALQAARKAVYVSDVG